MEKALLPKRETHRVFVEEFLKTGDQRASYIKAFPNAANWKPANVSTEASRLMRHPDVANAIGSMQERASAMAEAFALESIHRLNRIAEFDDDDLASRIAVAERANRTLLEAAGVLKNGAAIQVNVDNRSIDMQALDRWNTPGEDGLTGAERFKLAQTKAIQGHVVDDEE